MKTEILLPDQIKKSLLQHHLWTLLSLLLILIEWTGEEKIHYRFLWIALLFLNLISCFFAEIFFFYLFLQPKKLSTKFYIFNNKRAVIYLYISYNTRSAIKEIDFFFCTEKLPFFVVILYFCDSHSILAYCTEI